MTGEWKYSEIYNCWVCSICGSAALNDYAGRSTASNFCPTCGNPMIITRDTLKEDD
jgi:rRNA maturation endonuclease Nob1